MKTVKSILDRIEQRAETLIDNASPEDLEHIAYTVHLCSLTRIDLREIEVYRVNGDEDDEQDSRN
jgi:hypothetical protein